MSGVLDQSQTTSHANLVGVNCYGTYRDFQTFTAGLSGLLTEVDLWLYKNGTPVDLVVEIQSTSGGLPTGTVLASQQVSAASITHNTQLNITFSSPYSAVSGTKYAIVIKQYNDYNDGGFSKYIMYGDQGNNYYANGNSGYRSGGTWYNDSSGWDAWFKTYIEVPPIQQTINSNTKIKSLDNQSTIAADTKIKSLDTQEDVLSDAEIIYREKIKSDTKIKIFDNQQTINSNATIVARFHDDIISDTTIITKNIPETINSNTKIKSLDNQQIINSNARVSIIYIATINSDANISLIGVQETILSNATIVAETTVNIPNTVTFITCIKKNIENYIPFAKRILNNSLNFVNYFRGNLKIINNDIRTKGQKKYNIGNDVRLVKIWQFVPPEPPGGLTLPSGFWSLGKQYIKIYINSVEQTDADIDSCNIHKILNGASTMSFDLGRPYDSTKPALEAFVEIKYNGILLYSGYITSIIPSDSPESISINCQDNYWKTNKLNKYFYIDYMIGTKYETYYDTILAALATEFSWNPGIGNFMPEAIDCWAQNYNDCLVNLIQQCGNYNVYYDEFGNKQLWTSGAGSIINLNRQQLDKNIGLYDVLSMRFSEDASKLVNKYRVHTGTSLQKSQLVFAGGQLTPAWSNEASRIAKPGGSWQFGCNYFPLEEAETYADAWKIYSFGHGGLDTSEWSDAFPPYIMAWAPISFGVWNTNMMLPTIIKEGFSVDYVNKTVTFTEPKFITLYNQSGEISGLIPPSLRLISFRTQAYNYLENLGQNPETENTNPFVFFTEKMGDYSETILKTIELSQFSLQEGHSAIIDGQAKSVPAWNDMPFAQDFANWQLSQACDVEISGDVTITIDTMIYYNIKLKDRIYIAGVTTSALNIEAISYNLNNFTATLTLKNGRYYNRTQSYGFHGEKY